jgi:hypothetical protein
VHVDRGRQSRPDAAELPDAGLFGQVPDRTARNARFSRAAMRPAGTQARALSASSRSAAKWFSPPSRSRKSRARAASRGVARGGNVAAFGGGEEVTAFCGPCREVLGEQGCSPGQQETAAGRQREGQPGHVQLEGGQLPKRFD